MPTSSDRAATTSWCWSWPSWTIWCASRPATRWWIAASVAGYLVTQVEGVGVWLFAAIAMVAITIAWVVSWMVVESTMLDRRLGARRAAAYDLLSRARLEVTIDRS